MKVLVDKDFLEDGLELICDSIRLKTGGTGVLAFPVEIKQAVDAIETGGGGITPTGTKTITENGEGIDVTTFAAVDVAVPIPAGPSGKITITANETGIDVAQYAEADVAVPTGDSVMIDFTLTQAEYEITLQNVNMPNGTVSGLMLYPVSGVAANSEGTIYAVWYHPWVASQAIGNKYYFGGSYRVNEMLVGTNTPVEYNSTEHTLKIRASSGSGNPQLKPGNYKLVVW